MSPAAREARRVPERLARVARDLLAHLLLVGLGLAGAGLLGELALRAALGHPFWPPLLPEPYVDNARLYRPSPSRRYELNPGADDVVGRERVRIRVNAAGLRDDREYAVPKPAGVRRVLVLGDSFTFAGKVRLEETFPKRLERLLDQAAGERYEVLNLAVPGYNTPQQASLLAERGLAFEPDLVFVAFVLNDALPAAQLVPVNARLPLGLRRFLKRFALVQFVAASLKRLPAILAGRSFKGGSEVVDLAPGTGGWQGVQESLVEIQRLAAARGAGLLLVIWPMLEGLDGAYPFTAQHALVAGFCRERGIPTLDLLPAFRGAAPERYWVARDDHHPNAEAQRLAAEVVFATLRGGAGSLGDGQR